MDTGKRSESELLTLQGRTETDSSARRVEVVYFASVRETIGTGKETLFVPSGITTMRDFVAWLRARGPEYEIALDEGLGIRAAIDHVHATSDTPIQGAREIAIFPMMTGG